MSSYDSMSPSDEGYDAYEPPYYYQGYQQSSPIDTTGFWPNGDQDYEASENYPDNSNFLHRNNGYDEVPLSSNVLYENYNMQLGYGQNSLLRPDCDYQIPPRGYERSGQSFVRIVKRRNTANKKERRRTQSINTAFSDLRDCIPNVPADTKLSKKEHRRTENINSAFTVLRGRIPNVPLDTKLSKIKTLRLATSYISYLMRVLESDGEPIGGFKAELHQITSKRGRHCESQNNDKRTKGRTGWPQHVWALELKNEQNLQT